MKGRNGIIQAIKTIYPFVLSRLFLQQPKNNFKAKHKTKSVHSPINTLQKNEQFPSLTGIRAIAAFMVFFHHLHLHLRPNFLEGLQLSFYWGVDLFFVLSGFLITYRYYKKMEVNRHWFFIYFSNRFARIYPVYFFVLTVVILLKNNFDAIFLLQNYTLTHYLFFIFKSRGMAITASWSLTVEECFYFFAPFIFILSKKYNFWLPVLITVVILFFIIIRDGKEISDIFLIFSGTFFGCFLKFFAGVFLALIVQKNDKKRINYIKGQKWTLIGFGATILLSIPLVYVTNKAYLIQYSTVVIVSNFLMPFVIATLYFGLIYENSFFRRILSTRLMKLLGKSSYAFYLLHMPIIIYIGAPYLKPYFSNNYYNLYVITIFVFVILLSVIVFLCYENPLNVSIRKKSADFFTKSIKN